ncbi:MAG: presqualene diphosphate synthase HpnD [Reyranella sp.]|jgi:phytoene synthase|uniref:presqualene diphosphate synthase HpnD n=1 Tax=Reyranella sp. TaxID=1929291 RepID=UPI0025FFE053|nr:presqualene diphosphate synthase HpnD [Reyranella sp.]MBR2813430.1 presqualene diphosphate synthase HpnD [Reyranella sp.]
MIDLTHPDAAQFKARVSGSSFYTAMLLMPKAQREAMFAIYMYCRLVDDIADDGTRPRDVRATELVQWRRDLDALYAGRPAGQAAFLQGAVRDFGLKQADFLAVIDGMDMDVAADIHAPDRATLALYCDRVACAVGRLSTRIFGMDEAPGLELAHNLGNALQLTNILRDIDEDADINRLYLPRERLVEAGIETTDPLAVVADPWVDVACRKIAAEALDYFAAADRLLRAKPRGHLLAPRLMAAVYGALLQDMLKVGWGPPRRRVKISKPRLLYIVARCCVFG